MFFKKQKPIKIEFYTHVGQLMELFPPTLATDALPSWFEKLPSKAGKNVKHCVGIKDLFSKGIMIPLWSDYTVDLDSRKAPIISCPVAKQYPLYPPAEAHNLSEQAPGAWPGYQNVKFTSPWLVYTSEPIKWTCIQPVWNQHDPQQYTIVPGVIEFKYQNQLSVNTLWKNSLTPRTEKLKAGDSILQLVPVTDKPFEIEVKFLNQEIFSQKFTRWEYSFDLQYHKIKSLFEKRENKKCKY